MAEEIVIRHIGGTPICLKESSIESWGLRENCAVVICVGFTQILILPSLLIDPNVIVFEVIGSFILASGILIIGSFSNVLIRRLPAYTVYTGNDTISFLKTTPETDQISICKAAKTLEERAREYEKHQKELERIAGNCK